MILTLLATRTQNTCPLAVSNFRISLFPSLKDEHTGMKVATLRSGKCKSKFTLDDGYASCSNQLGRSKARILFILGSGEVIAILEGSPISS